MLFGRKCSENFLSFHFTTEEKESTFSKDCEIFFLHFTIEEQKAVLMEKE